VLGTSADDLRGLEFDWLAVDADGHVAFLSTAGGGLVPAGVDPDAHDAALEAILSAPMRAPAAIAPDLGADLPNPWREMAERGVFGFDSSPVGGPYRKVAAPSRPVLLADLPLSMAAVAVALGVSFASVGVIDPTQT
jgi:hypothetical protein